MFCMFLFICCKVDYGNLFLCELIVFFGMLGYVLLFEIEVVE